MGLPSSFEIHAAQAVIVPPTLEPREVAALVDAGATAGNSVRVALEASPRRVLLIGAGTIGWLAAELLRLAGIDADVVHPSPMRREALASLGHRVVATFDELGPAYDVVIDCAGVPEVVGPGIGRLAPRGSYLLAGYARVPDLDLAAVARKEARIVGIRSGRRADLEAVLDAAATGEIRLPQISEWPLAEINDAFAALRARTIPGKAVIASGARE